jgi:DNA repair exonuclease SbcCD ATPase subunit
MIHFEKIKFKNILSTGNAWTEIKLDANKSTLVLGENGAGKSTMLDAISFALYGKAFRNIKKPQLLNSINQKELMVEIEFKIGTKKYNVKRGIKPNIFEIWCNGELLNQDAAARDYQSYLEESILKLNYKSFGQVVVLGSSTFVPFMQLKAGERRAVIEDLLDIQIFTVMNTLLKEKVSANKEEIQEIKYQIDLLKNRIDSAKEHNDSIRELKEGEVAKLKEKLKEQIALIESEQQAVDALMEEVAQLAEGVADKPAMKKKLQELEKIDGQLSNKLSKLRKDIAFYHDHDNCPTCRQGIEHEFKTETIAESNAKIEEIETAKRELDNRLGSVNTRLEEIDSIESVMSGKNLEMSEHNANYKMAMNVCKSIKTELTEAQESVEAIDTSAIKKLEDDLNSYHTKQGQLFDDKEMLGLVSSMLKDGGIKTRIIKQYVPVMNKLINKYLAAMDFFVQFELDENFNETIKSRFRDVFSYASFSEGEKLRIDLALLFTWRAVSKLRNSVSTNLLIMDEIMDSSLDNAGTEEFLKIINEITADSNVFIISHKGDQLYEKFDHVIRFEKVKNFSRMAA